MIITVRRGAIPVVATFSLNALECEVVVLAALRGNPGVTAVDSGTLLARSVLFSFQGCLQLTCESCCLVAVNTLAESVGILEMVSDMVNREC